MTAATRTAFVLSGGASLGALQVGMLEALSRGASPRIFWSARVPDRSLRRLIGRYLEFGDLADAPIPLHLIAFDLLEGRELRLSDGPAVEAIAASAAIPGITRQTRS
jgi:predicted acylesterase/phospholipase RssA